MRYTYIATCNPGLEEVAIAEVYELIGSRACVKHKGAIIFEADEDAIYRLNYLSRSLHRIILLLHEATFNELDDLYRIVRGIDFSEYIEPHQSFAVRPERVGIHNFTSIDVGRVVGQAVIDSYMESKNVRLKVNLDEPDVEVGCEVRGNRFWIGIDTTGESLHKRWYRVSKHEAPLKSTIAYSMVRISNWSFDESLCDPMCGGGTIPIEAALYANDAPPNPYRGFNFEKLRFLDLSRYLKIKEEHRVKDRLTKIYCIDSDRSSVRIARSNSIEARVLVNLIRSDSTVYPLDFDRILVDLPFGIRTSRRGLKELYESFFKNALRYSWKSLVAITVHPEYVPIEPSRRYTVEYGKLNAEILVFEA